MTPQALAATHEAAFPGDGWDIDSFAGYLADPKVTVHGDATSFAVIRRIGEEAEVLTLATAPDSQGAGRATAMLAAALAAERAAGARTVILDVDVANAAARALYARAGFRIVAERKDYYRNVKGGRSTALILRKSL